jgi:nitrous oxidase accessory protein
VKRVRSLRAAMAGALGLALARPPQAAAQALDAGILQALVDRAAPRSTLILRRGSYYGSLVVWKSLTILAEGGTILVARPDTKGSTLSVLADDVAVIGLAVRGSGSSLRDLDAGIAVRGNRVRLDACSIEGATFGIRLDDCVGGSVLSCRVRGKSSLPFAERGDGIRVTLGRDCLVEGADIASVCDGIYLDGSTRPRILNSRVSDGRYGLHVMYGSLAEVEGLKTHRLVVGAMIMGTKGARLTENSFAEGREARSSGLTLFASEDCVCAQNLVSGNTTGLSLDGAKDCSLRGNTVSGNARGIFVEGASPGTRVYGNSFIDNAVQVGGAGELRSIAWTDAGKGNYWDDYRGYDLDGNGIGDAPYRRGRSFAALCARTSLLGAFFGSPLQRISAGLDPEAEIVDPAPLAREPREE